MLSLHASRVDWIASRYFFPTYSTASAPLLPMARTHLPELKWLKIGFSRLFLGNQNHESPIARMWGFSLSSSISCGSQYGAISMVPSDR
jgi:hypothetical protein